VTIAGATLMIRCQFRLSWTVNVLSGNFMKPAGVRLDSEIERTRGMSENDIRIDYANLPTPEDGLNRSSHT
jgi:hypothetical protein